jgi:hypothetical protein
MRIGLIGSGRIGSTLARLAVEAGHEVVLANSRGPETLVDLVAELGPRARAATPEEVARAGEVVVVAIPLRAYASVPVDDLAGKVVIDTNNYYPDRDGRIEVLDDASTTSSQLLADHLPQSRVVKAFNTIFFKELGTQGSPEGTPGRRALPIAGDDPDAKRVVEGLLDAFGFDSLDAGPLAQGWRFQPGTPAYNVPMKVTELRGALASA